ncbi:MAG: hypothetical protein P8J86_07170 [Phycisphaerales bacterium]|nr:hypothetical protein [Phycisphaerales bacterium]
MTVPEHENRSSLKHTVVSSPRLRVFLPMPLGERLKGLAWWMMRYFLFRPSFALGNKWRCTLLRIFGAKIGAKVVIDPSVKIDFPWNLHIGTQSIIARGVILNCMGLIDIGSQVRISQYAHLCAGTHLYEREDMRIKRSGIKVGDQSWLATDTFVGPGVNIGSSVILAARSSAFSDLPSDYICLGEPARAFKKRSEHTDPKSHS